MGPRTEHVEDEQHGAEGDAGVGDVEGPEVPRADVDVDEVDDAPATTRSIRLPTAPATTSVSARRDSRVSEPSVIA